MTDLLTLHKYFLSQHLRRGGVAVDFTMGNGHDTQYLCNAVYGGEAAPGKVYAFDIQQAAVDSTARLLRESGTPEPFDAGVFNLGWLPGSDKKVTTQRSSTLPAIEAAVSLLAPGGILLVAVYPGHEEGRLEGEAIAELLSQKSRFEMSVGRFQFISSPTSPYFFIIEKKEPRA